jgi:hypothetical protein
MNDPITIEREELIDIVDRAIDRTLTELGIKRKILNPWMSQNQASKLVGRRRIERAMEQGLVEWHKPNMDKIKGRIYIRRKDVEKILNNPR